MTTLDGTPFQCTDCENMRIWKDVGEESKYVDEICNVCGGQREFKRDR